jgi:hypothetical protein
MRIMNRIFTIVLIVFFMAGTVLAGQGKGDASSLAGKLKNKVLLTDEQTSKVESILKNYLAIATADRGAKGTQYRADIEALLNERQKAKYDIIKDNWWAEVNKTGG